jgi:hypothetical protein
LGSAAIMAAGFGILPNPLREREMISKSKPRTRRVSGKMPNTVFLHEKRHFVVNLVVSFVDS